MWGRPSAMSEDATLFEGLQDCLRAAPQLLPEWAKLLQAPAGSSNLRSAIRRSVTGKDCLLLRSSRAAWELDGRLGLRHLTQLLKAGLTRGATIRVSTPMDEN